MAAGIRLPGVSSSSWLVFPSSSLGPSRSALALTGASVSPHALPASLSWGAPTTPHFFFLQFPPPPSSILALPHRDADPGVIPCWCPRPLRTSLFLFGSPISCHRGAYFYIVPFQLSSASIPQRGLCVLPHILFHFQCHSFHCCAPSYYDSILPCFRTTLICWHYLDSVFSFAYFFSLPVYKCGSFFFPEICFFKLFLAFPSCSLFYTVSFWDAYCCSERTNELFICYKEFLVAGKMCNCYI